MTTTCSGYHGTLRARSFVKRRTENMKSVVGIFNSLADAKRGAALLRTVGITEDRITVLSPQTSETQIEEQVPMSDAEQPGMGSAVGGTLGAAIGIAGGM